MFTWKKLVSAALCLALALAAPLHPALGQETLEEMAPENRALFDQLRDRYRKGELSLETNVLTESNEPPPAEFDGLHRQADSAAHLVWEYYGGVPKHNELVVETDRFDSARLDYDDDVDIDDFGIFQACISGPGIPADPTCAD